MNLNPFSSSFNKNPADAAMPYLDKIPETISPYYDPYINSGQKSLQELMKQYQSLISDPGGKMNEIGQGFQQSPGYQFQYNQGMNAANSAAAAGGMAGTPFHQMHASSMSSDLANQDYYNYLSRALGLYGTGLQGHEGINQMGYGASNELANSLANNLMNQGNLAYAGTQHQNQSNADLFNSLLGIGSSLGGALIGMNNPNQNRI